MEASLRWSVLVQRSGGQIEHIKTVAQVLIEEGSRLHKHQQPLTLLGGVVLSQVGHGESCGPHLLHQKLGEFDVLLFELWYAHHIVGEVRFHHGQCGVVGKRAISLLSEQQTQHVLLIDG